MEITDSSTMQEIFDYVIGTNDDSIMRSRATKYVRFLYTRNLHQDYAKCTKIALDNLGYYGGYHSVETRRKIETVLRAIHPVLGSVNIKRTPEEVFQMGVEWAKNSEKKKIFHMRIPSIK